ncbi:MAG: hypothetical protein JST68_27175, partial [Bacteroidetes bacterium]|nr:hypothetical protein [Bacteroidota bacterium]
MIQRLIVLVLALAIAGPLPAQPDELKNLVHVSQTRLNGNITSLLISPNGKYLAAAGEENKIVVWDLQTGLQEFVFEGHTSKVSCLSFSADSRFLISGGGDNLVKIWDLSVSQLAYRFRMHGPGFIAS